MESGHHVEKSLLQRLRRRATRSPQAASAFGVSLLMILSFGKARTSRSPLFFPVFTAGQTRSAGA